MSSIYAYIVCINLRR